jgi:hypothetical protein
MRVLILDTIGALIDGNMVLRAYCNNPKCHHCVLLDLEALSTKLGRDHGCLHDQLVPKLYCSKCKSKDLALILSTQETEGRGHV